MVGIVPGKVLFLSITFVGSQVSFFPGGKLPVCFFEREHDNFQLFFFKLRGYFYLDNIAVYFSYFSKYIHFNHLRT